MDLYGLPSSSSDEFSARLASLVLAGIGIIAGAPLLIGIIRYERFGCGSKRTILNMLASTVSCINVLLILFDRSLDLLLFTIGPLPSILCDIKVSLKIFLICFIALCLDAIAVTRYLFLFWISNPMAIDDKFWHKIITRTIAIFSWIFTTVVIVGSQWRSIVFEVCKGTEIKPEKQDFLLLNLGALIVASMILHMVIKIRVWIFESKVKYFPETELVFYKGAYISDLKKRELFSLATSFICFVILAAAIIYAFWFKTFRIETINSKPQNLPIWLGHLIAPTMFTLTIVISFYQKAALRKYVYKEILKLSNFRLFR